MEWLKHFDAITKTRLHVPAQYRLLILDGCEIHIHIALVEYCINARIVPYCLPAHSTHLLQPLEVGLYSPLQKYYGQQVDKLIRYGRIAVTKGNFLRMLVQAWLKTFAKENILSAWRGSGLIPPNARVVLTQLPSYRVSEGPAPTPPPMPPTPFNSAALLHRARQAKLLLKKSRNSHDTELAEFIDSLERFAINKDKDLQLERDINQKWQEPRL